MSISAPSQPKRMATKEILVPTNQLHISMPTDWAVLLRKYSIWRYQLSERQDYYRVNIANRKYFYGGFTNAYKNQVDRPFYFFTNEKPQAALYALLPHGQSAQPWEYQFGKQMEEITGELISPDELKPQVLIKLMLALCFYENGSSSNEKDRRVCQSNFYLRVKGQANGKFLTAVEIQPMVDEQAEMHTLTLKVEANTFERIEPEKVGDYAHLGAFFELFESQGHTYLRQLRPNQVATFTRQLYRQRTFSGKRTQADWHHNGSRKHPQQYQESRSYQVRHVQERLSSFLGRYGFGVALAEELMQRQKPSKETLPLHRLPTVQVIDNRLNQATVPAADYLKWLNAHPFTQGKAAYTLTFELVKADKVDATRPVLALLDADRPAFETANRQLGLLALAGHQDPYRLLYQKLPAVVKQSLNVNPNEVGKYTVAQDFLQYAAPVSLPPPAAKSPALTDETALAEPETTEPATNAAPETEEEKQARLETAKAVRQSKTLVLKLDVCLSELWLKWVIAGKDADAAENPSLPLLTKLNDEWGFITNNWLLYFEQGTLRFADLDTPEGKQLLKARFTSWREIKQRFLSRQPKYASLQPGDEKAETALRKAHFVLVGRTTLEIEQTETIAMPNWPVINLIKVAEPGTSAKSLAALGVYAGGVWATPQGHRYLVSGFGSSQVAEPRGHHMYQIHPYASVSAAQLATLRSLLTVTFVRRNQFTVWPYPFDLLRLQQEMQLPLAS